jgi:leader peptidase (prepilin peptidase)/N-methyltransferase
MLDREWRQQCAALLADPAAAPAPQADAAPFNLIRPRSACPSCKTPIKARHNLPVLGWLWLRGRCAACQAAIPARYPVVEAGTGLLSGFVVWTFGLSPEAIAALLLTWSLIALAVIDLDHHLLPDAITLPLLWAGLLVNLGGLFTDLASAVLGAVAGYLSLWAVYHLFRLVTGKEGMGHGDFKMLAMFGAWLGWQLLPLVILLSSLVGAAVGIALIVSGRHARGVPIPFGPFLALAGWIALLWGDALVAGYLAWAQPG